MRARADNPLVVMQIDAVQLQPSSVQIESVVDRPLRFTNTKRSDGFVKYVSSRIGNGNRRFIELRRVDVPENGVFKGNRPFANGLVLISGKLVV